MVINWYSNLYIQYLQDSIRSFENLLQVIIFHVIPNTKFLKKNFQLICALVLVYNSQNMRMNTEMIQFPDNLVQNNLLGYKVGPRIS